MESTPQSKLYSDVSPPVTVRHSSSCGGGSSVGGSGFGCIEHTVSKFDTLAGVAIRYGVEVADIKKMNGLTTDLQMFAYTITREASTISHNVKRVSYSRTHAMDNVPVANGKGAGIDKSIEKLVRRRKSEVDLNNHTLEMLLKHDNNNTTTSSSRIVLSTSAGKGLALRQKTANRTTIESEAGSSNMFPVGSRDSSIVQAFNGVRKSSSAPSFQHSETHNNNSNNNNTSSPSSSLFWPISILNFTADLQALSTTTPIFDGLPRPVSGRKNKAARD
ncbi:Peptidoglycan-binding lysin domain-containing protein [Cynara cardunculus var. scolymus]|uniref:Peptidoglycan-binding lysin domain-containing protein n=1 Tax=Cynara cardunculus var. scolymus TaxID=59895 RepID=A0A103XS10_CYNCS|nr:Peptidoglycan-binding lysin domain-containing protein [Cynara cardunculus var. scolymus]